MAQIARIAARAVLAELDKRKAAMREVRYTFAFNFALPGGEALPAVHYETVDPIALRALLVRGLLRQLRAEGEHTDTLPGWLAPQVDDMLATILAAANAAAAEAVDD